MQTLWSQMENYASTISDFENRLTLIAISNVSLQLQAKEQQRFSEKLQTRAENRAADFHRILHEVQVLTRAHEENRVATQQQLNQSELTLVDLSNSNKNLGDLVIGLTKENSPLSERLRSFEGLLEQRETKSAPESVQSTSSVEPPPATPVSDFTHQLLLDLQSALVRMESEMSDIKEFLDTSINSQAFGRAVKYTTVPTSDEQAHCEFFIKQLVDQAKLCHLSDEECKLLLGLKLTSDKVHPALNQWWIAYSKTKSGDVWTEIYDNFKDRFCNRTQRELAYAIRLQTILDDIDVPDHQGVVIFKRGVRHARAESCLDNTDKELTSISDCMKLLRTRQIRLDDPPVYQERLKSRPASASTNTTSSRTTYSDVSTTSTPEQSPRHTRKSSKVGFRDQATLEDTASYGSLEQASKSLFRGPSPTCNEFPLWISTTPQSKPRPAPTPVMISSKPDDCTTSGAKVCGRCDRLGHGSVDCPRKFARCTTCHQIGHYAGEHAKSCSFCKQIGHTYSRCPSKPADKA
ncbi:hypothetical protein Ae201684P_000159 [Aphanomyces euteiches]|nr:hypothetical protein Ae201684P_000159 [Aphanomyces euteiches]